MVDNGVVVAWSVSLMEARIYFAVQRLPCFRCFRGREDTLKLLALGAPVSGGTEAAVVLSEMSFLCHLCSGGLGTHFILHCVAFGQFPCFQRGFL